MQISYLGHSSFQLKGKKITVITDPYDKSVGFTMPKSKAGIVTISHNHSDHNALDRIEGEPFVINGPGEYEIGGVFVYGYKTFHDDKKGEARGLNTIYLLNIDGFKVCHLGDLGDELSDKIVDELDSLDALFIPVGGVYTIDAKQAKKMIEKIEPRLVIPMHYKTDKHSEDFKDLAGIDEFIKEWDKEPLREEKVDLTKYTEEEDTQLMIIEPKQ